MLLCDLVAVHFFLPSKLACCSLFYEGSACIGKIEFCVGFDRYFNGFTLNGPSLKYVGKKGWKWGGQDCFYCISFMKEVRIGPSLVSCQDSFD